MQFRVSSPRLYILCAACVASMFKLYIYCTTVFISLNVLSTSRRLSFFLFSFFSFLLSSPFLSFLLLSSPNFLSSPFFFFVVHSAINCSTARGAKLFDWVSRQPPPYPIVALSRYSNPETKQIVAVEGCG